GQFDRFRPKLRRVQPLRHSFHLHPPDRKLHDPSDYTISSLPHLSPCRIGFWQRCVMRLTSSLACAVLSLSMLAGRQADPIILLLERFRLLGSAGKLTGFATLGKPWNSLIFHN
ncbi:hypothetical protein, partial [Dechloromonas sp.]|uniref:hypothetical protein n=1 Tax=Dechloromonas sp. TaxID=1917218 RepID=UPI00263F83FF